MILQHALQLAAKGFYVFPLKPESKEPAITAYTAKASRDPETLRVWFAGNTKNIGIITQRFWNSESNQDEALVVVDVDVKGKHNGFDSLRELERSGFCLSETLSQDTPSGGKHFIFRNPQAVRSSVGNIAGGIDIRSRGGYIVGPGSTISGKTYTLRDGSVCIAPTWLVDRCALPVLPRQKEEDFHGIIPSSQLRAEEYLVNDAPLAISGDGGNETTYRVACHLKELGMDEYGATCLMDRHWNPRCEPPWTWGELCAITANAYRYSQQPRGATSPEAAFPETIHDDSEGPMDRLNRNYAFVIAGGGHHIIHETKDAKNNDCIHHLNELTFHRKFAAELIQIGDGKLEPVTKLWMKSKKRRSYDGFVFRPGLEVPKNLYNLWRGFAVKPQEGEIKHESLDKFLEHARENVCGGDEKLFRWLIGYFAHLVQKPWEKPLTALVFRGKKGVGKNALVDRIGHLLGGHYLSTPDRRYLVGNFNGHLENCLLFTLDEAFWSGDKQAEGVLKSVITGQTHVIEHKGKEVYSVDNCTRVVILGNEDWLVPATHDERRYAVFQVGDGRKQDRMFFERMRVGMEQGGYRHLLAYLKAFDLTGIEVNEAPKTKALLEQKEESLDILDAWWLNCLKEGYVSEDMDWPKEILCSTVRNSFLIFCKERQVRSRLPDPVQFGKRLRDLCGTGLYRARKREGIDVQYVYKFPTLLEARTAWDKHIGHNTGWENDPA